MTGQDLANSIEQALAPICEHCQLEAINMFRPTPNEGLRVVHVRGCQS